MHLSNKKALIIGIKTLRPTVDSLIIEFIAKLVSILAIVIDKEVTKTETSFLAWQTIGT